MTVGAGILCLVTFVLGLLVCKTGIL
jgi:hypothetical protein